MLGHLNTFVRHPAARAVGLVFGLNSLAGGTWAVVIPFVKDKLLLSEAGLGLVLLFMPAGIVLANPLSGWLLQHLGLRKTMLLGTSVFLVSMGLLPLMPSVYLLGINLFVAGLADSPMAVSMNTFASQIENEDGVKIMSSCHGMFSLGALIGAAAFQLGLIAGLPASLYMAILMALALLTLPFISQSVGQGYQPKRKQGQKVFRWPTRHLTLMILIAFPLLMAEGVVFDWSAVYLRDYTSIPSHLAGLGFVGFSMAMTLGRFSGDAILHGLTGRKVVFRGALTVATGFFLVALVPSPFPVIIGFTLVGMGAFLIAPVLFGAAARAPGYAPGAGLAVFSTFTFTAFIAGPPLVGLVAEELGLGLALGLVGFGALFSALGGLKLSLG